MMTIRYHAAGVTERRMWGSMQSWQDFCTTISILVGNFAILLGNFRSQTIIWITVKPEKRRWKFFCFNIQDSKTVFKWDQTRIATCETFYIIFFYVKFHSLGIRKSGKWFLQPIFMFRKNCVFFHNSLQPLPRLHRCKRPSKLSIQCECTVIPDGWKFLYNQ